jgi:hypothetical protein
VKVIPGPVRDRGRSEDRPRGRREGPRRIGDLFIDPARRKVRVGDRAVALANTEFARIGAVSGLLKGHEGAEWQQSGNRIGCRRLV